MHADPMLRPRASTIVTALWRAEDRVAADATPDNMSLARYLLGAVFECRPSIGRPRHLVDAVRALDALDPQAGRELA